MTKSVQFPIPAKCNEGHSNSIALNDNGLAALAYCENSFTSPTDETPTQSVFIKTGTVIRNSVQWKYRKGYEIPSSSSPKIALSNSALILLHLDSSNDWVYQACKVDSDGLTGGFSSPVPLTGYSPSIAVNNNGVVVLSYLDLTKDMYFQVGQIQSDGTSISWGSPVEHSSGSNPQVAINDANLLVESHEPLLIGYNRYYTVGVISGTGTSATIGWGTTSEYGIGWSCTLALTNDNILFSSYLSPPDLDNASENLILATSTTADLDAYTKTLSWTNNEYQAATGRAPTISINNSGIALLAMDSSSLFYPYVSVAVALFMDRSTWIGDNLSTLGHKTLSRLVLPGSHDAGMYETGFLVSSMVKTQDQTVFQQLMGGIRYFDLRPEWDGSEFYIYHGWANGPLLSAILEDVSTFLNCPSVTHELILLKFSHFSGFTVGSEIYDNLVTQITTTIGSKWLFALPEGNSLNTTTLSEFVGMQSKVVILCDGAPKYNSASKVYGYRDWPYLDDAPVDLIVYDQYSNSNDFETMKSDQISKFELFEKHYDGKFAACDLFLLSWTLTPTAFNLYSGVIGLAGEANPLLGQNTATIAPNTEAMIPNILFVDYYEQAAVTDIALILSTDLLSGGPRQLQANVIYVNSAATGSNDGTSWDNAYTELQSALGTKVAGSQVWVAAGEYQPSPSGDISATFTLTNGIKVYGGFTGTESSIGSRDPAKNVTTLTGVYSGPDPANALTIVTIAGDCGDVVLDGFTITGGRATTEGAGGLLISKLASPDIMPQISNCTFKNNFGNNGGAIYILSGNLTLIGCNFQSNTSAEYGGAIYNNTISMEEGLENNLLINNCTFNNNTALTSHAEGGAIYNNAREASIIFGCVDSVFTGNNSQGNGGAVGNQCYAGRGFFQFSGCTFTDNKAGYNSAVIVNGAQASGQCVVTLSSCWQSENTSLRGNDFVNHGNVIITIKTQDTPAGLSAKDPKMMELSDKIETIADD